MSGGKVQTEEEWQEGQLGGKLAGLSLPRQIWTISLWPLVEQILAFFVSASDLFIASRIGGAQSEVIAITDGMGAVGYIAWLGFVMQGAVAMGATAVVSRLVGGRKFLDANYAAMQALVLGLIAGALSCILMQWSLEFLVRDVLEIKNSAVDYALEYMRIMAFAAPFSGAVFAVNGALRGSGDTRTPFFVMAGINVVNVIVSCLLVWGPSWIGGHGVAGIATGSVAGFVVGLAVLLLILKGNRRRIFGRLLRREEKLEIVVREKGRSYIPPLYLDTALLKPDWKMLWRITRIGGPQAIEIFIIWAIQFYSLRIVSSLPQTGALGAHIIVVRTESMSFLPGFAIGTAASTLVGQYLGACNPEAARNVIRCCCRYAMIFMGVFGVLFFLFPAAFVGIFASKSPELVALAAPALKVAAISEISFAVAIVLKMSLRAAGDVKRVMFFSFLCMGFWRVIVLTVWARQYPETLTLLTIWTIFAVDTIIQSLVFWMLFRGEKWTKYEV